MPITTVTESQTLSLPEINTKLEKLDRGEDVKTGKAFDEEEGVCSYVTSGGVVVGNNWGCPR